MGESSGERFTYYFCRYNEELYQYMIYELKVEKEEAMDLLEEVWITFWEKIFQIQDFKEIQIRKWLRKTAYYKVRNYRRKKQYCSEIPYPEEELENFCQTGEKSEEPEREILEECILALRPLEQEVINIRREGKSYQDISQMMNRSIQSLECIHSRAVKKLKQMVGRKLTSFW